MNVFSITSETGFLKSVVLGIADRLGPPPTTANCYDPVSLNNIVAQTYPKEQQLIAQLSKFEEVLMKHDVEVYRPRVFANCNQIFARDVGFVVDDFFVKSNILPQRNREFNGLSNILSKFNPQKIKTPPSDVHIEGGDVIVWKDFLFVGCYKGADYASTITARTNEAAVLWLKEVFPQKQVIPIYLIKSNTDPFQNVLHLDCCFQPIGENMAILYVNGFSDPKQALDIVEQFGQEQVFLLSAQEAVQLQSNLFSISPKVIISDPRFERLNHWLRKKGMLVEEVAYHFVGKLGGLFRCTTLPLNRI